MHASIAEREQSRTFHCAKIQFFFGLEHRNQVFLHENLEVWNKKHYLAPKNRKDRGLQRNNKNSVPLYLCVE